MVRYTYAYTLALVIALVLNATANLLIKASAGAGGITAGGAIRSLATNWLFLVGLMCFGLNLVAYQFALQKLPISVAYPIMVSGGYAIIVVVARLMGERLLPAQWVGVALILAGVTLVSAYIKPKERAAASSSPMTQTPEVKASAKAGSDEVGGTG